MVRYVGSVVVPYTRERVFNLMADWRNLKVWDLNIIKSDLAAGQADDAVGVGVRYDCEFKVGNQKPIAVAYECVRYKPGTEAGFVGLATLFRSEDAVTVTDNPDKPGHSNVTAEFNLHFRGILSPLSFVMAGTMEKTGPIVMKDIEKFVSSTLGKEDETSK